VVARIEAVGGRAVAAQADISDVAAVARMFDSAETAFGGVDGIENHEPGIVHHAIGIFKRGAEWPLQRVTDGMVRDVDRR